MRTMNIALLEDEAVVVDGADVVGAGDEGDVVAGGGQAVAEEGADGSRTEDQNAHGASPWGACRGWPGR